MPEASFNSAPQLNPANIIKADKPQQRYGSLKTPASQTYPTRAGRTDQTPTDLQLIATQQIRADRPVDRRRRAPWPAPKVSTVSERKPAISLDFLLQPTGTPIKSPAAAK